MKYKEIGSRAALIVDKIRLVHESRAGDLPLHESVFDEADASSVAEAVKNGFVSGFGGPQLDAFENEVSKIVGCDHAVAVVNATLGLSIALRAVGVEPNDEVLVPSISFVATANSVSHIGGVPHFVECSPSNLGIDCDALEIHLSEVGSIRRGGFLFNKLTGRRIKALVGVHVFGHPCELDRLVRIAEIFNLALIEDAAEALGSFFKCRPVGSFGSLSVISFNGNKIVTSGGGGMICTSSPDLAQRCRHLATTAKVSGTLDLDHDQIGYNGRLPNLNAALGLSQLSRLAERIEKKRALYLAYKDVFEDVGFCHVLGEPEDCISNFWLQAIVLDGDDNLSFRNEILVRANREGVQLRPLWKPLHLLKPYINSPRANITCAIDFSTDIINVPSNPA